MKRIAIVLLIVGCRKWTWTGLPPNASCAWSGDIALCIVENHSYACVRNYDDATVRCAKSMLTNMQAEQPVPMPATSFLPQPVPTFYGTGQ